MPPQAQNTEKTIESFATGTQYKMTMRVFKPSGAYTTTTKYNCSRISMDKYEFTETGLYRIVTYANRHPKTMLQTAISSIFVYINFWRSFRYGKKTFGSCFASHCVDFWFNILRMSFL